MKRLFRGRLDEKQARLLNTLYFLVRLLALSAPLYFIISYGDLYPLQAITASNSALILHGLGYQVAQDGPVVAVSDGLSSFRFFISEDSTAWKSMLFLFALIFAVPKVRIKKRLLGILWGLPLVWIGNLGRVVGIVLVERSYGIGAALFWHDFLWRAGLVALVLGLWLVWLGGGRRRLFSRWHQFNTWPGAS
ncbi:MAG: exosortase/archaeosortase family protein [Candidatus Aenigmarchaeota archaeon]|nr:exosortase/archaeosortase family protein [Candidatus Aenigmarchaeota archaeon]